MTNVTNTINTTDTGARFAPTESLLVTNVRNTSVSHNTTNRTATLNGDAPLATIEFTADTLDGNKITGVTHIYWGQRAPDFKTGSTFVIVGRRTDRWFEALGFFEQTTGAAPLT